MGDIMDEQAPRSLWANLKNSPRAFKDSLIRHGPIQSDRVRSQAVFSNLFLHLHATRTHVRSLRFSATMAMGIASLSLFLILTVTGVLLMVYYKPSVELAYNSVKDIHFVVPAGRLIRNVHRWAAHLMVVTVLLHMTRVFYTACYKEARQFNWVVGMLLLILTLGLSFTGYLLPWDQLAYWAITIGANIAGSPAELTDTLGITSQFDPGGLIREVLLGASNVGQEALTRFYVLHVMVLPLVMALLMGIHFWRIRKDGGLGRPGLTQTPAGKGASSPDLPAATPSDSPQKSYGLMCIVKDRTPATNVDPVDTVPSWPYLLNAELLVFVVVLGLCLLMALGADAPLKEAANPSVPENPAKAPWYFLGLQEMVSYSAFVGGMVVPTLVILGLCLVPYLDREKEKLGVYLHGRPAKRTALSSLIFGASMAILAVAVPVKFGWLRQWFPNINQMAIIVMNPGTLLTLAYMVWSIFVYKRTGSTRRAAIALYTCFIVGFIILTYVGAELRGPNWDFFWSKSDWPVH
jgi:quinol-cytochrome oxidoreductase complex cytochrome b subunit